MIKTIKIDRKDIKNGATPIFDHCRKMVKEGYSPETMLEVWRDDILSMRMPIGEGAKLTVREEPFLSFQKFNPMSEKDRARLAARMAGKATRSRRTFVKNEKMSIGTAE